MSIVLARIDDRLVHGQVVEGWLRVINADCIVVVNDVVAGDEMQCALYSISIPPDKKIECLAVESAIKKFLDGNFDEKKVLILFSKPSDALKFIKSGIKILSINVGGLHYSTGKKQLAKGLSVDDKDVADLKEIAKLGIEVEGRVLPMDERQNVIDLITKYY